MATPAAAATGQAATSKGVTPNAAAAATTGGTAKAAAPKKKKARKKKSADSKRSGSSSSASALLSRQNKQALAAAARSTLSSMQAEAEARRNDAAWLGAENLAAAAVGVEGWYGGSSGMTRGLAGKNGATGLFLAEEVGIVDGALRANGMSREDLTVEAFGCLLEQARRYALELTADAQDYAAHSSRNDVSSADLQLAVEFREDGPEASQLPPPDRMFALSEEVNRTPLPSIPSNCYNGIVLPAPEYQLTARTFDVVSSARVAQRMGRGGTVPPPALFGGFAGAGASSSAASGAAAAVTTSGVGTTGGSTAKGSGGTKRKRGTGTAYGASRGRQQVAINLKSNKSDVSAAAATAAAAAVAAANIPVGQQAPVGAAPSLASTVTARLPQGGIPPSAGGR